MFLKRIFATYSCNIFVQHILYPWILFFLFSQWWILARPESSPTSPSRLPRNSRPSQRRTSRTATHWPAGNRQILNIQENISIVDVEGFGWRLLSFCLSVRLHVCLLSIYPRGPSGCALRPWMTPEKLHLFSNPSNIYVFLPFLWSSPPPTLSLIHSVGSSGSVS